MCTRPDTKAKAPVSEARPFLPTCGTSTMEGVGLSPAGALVRSSAALGNPIARCICCGGGTGAVTGPDKTFVQSAYLGRMVQWTQSQLFQVTALNGSQISMQRERRVRKRKNKFTMRHKRFISSLTGKKKAWREQGKVRTLCLQQKPPHNA
jgi:hypothetical protein